MRARALVLSILSSTAVLAAGWQLGVQGQADTAVVSAAPTADAAAPSSAGTSSTASPTPTTTPTPSSSASSGSASSGSATAGTSGSSTGGSSAASVSGTFTGTATRTRYGNVQVQITVESGTITDVTALQLTDQDQRSVSISNRAAPILRQEVLAAQSAKVQSVSGATYTSEGYLTSLQSALDQAGL